MYLSYETTIIFMAEYLPWWVGVGILAFYVLGRDKKRELLMIIHSFAAALVARFIFTDIIRYFYDRPRPFEVLGNVYQLMQHSPGGAFPSGHAAFFFALATGVFFYKKWWGVLFYAAALTISFSRVAAGIHWTSDILGGAVIGILSAWLVKILLKNFAGYLN
ncbi:MAG: phosphatase PAP2 family protein [Candidatus Giovannonibacteria bacterium]|nr:MAG: phosphatase PAP2 family protein [Candidatus Giovannonibacteria bacterium]